MSIGLIALLAPLISLSFVNSKRFLITIVELLTTSIIFYTSVSLFLLSIHALTIVNIQFLGVMFATCCIYYYFYNREQSAFNFNEAVLLVCVIGIATTFLAQVHYGYKGQYSTLATTQLEQSEEFIYPYPYFSDEWYAVAMVNYSKDHNTLPIVNPLKKDVEYFVNYEIAFHSLITGLVTLLKLSPLTDFTKLSIVFNVIIILLLYILARSLQAPRYAASATALSGLYILSSANLPGLWNLLPVTVGAITILNALVFMHMRRYAMVFILIIFLSVIYPPFLVFYIPAVVVHILYAKHLSRVQKTTYFKNLGIVMLFMWHLIGALYYAALYTNFIILATVFILLTLLLTFLWLQKQYPLHWITQKYISTLLVFFVIVNVLSLLNPEPLKLYITSLLQLFFYTSYIPNAIPNYLIHLIIPTAILLLSLIGLLHTKKCVWLKYSIAFGILFWLGYSFTDKRYIIEYQRVVYFTSLLVVLISAFGYQFIIEKLQKFIPFSIRNYALVMVFACFVLLSPRYTMRDSWKDLTLTDFNGNQFVPAAPANQYLHPDDLKIFSEIHNATFLSEPWKGTVIGVATDNYPFLVKSGTISFNEDSFYIFNEYACNKKRSVTLGSGIDYVYLKNLSCGNYFEQIATSAEGFALYKPIPIE